MTGTLDEAVEVVSVDSRAVFRGREPEGTPQCVGYERIVVSGCGQIAFVHREYQHVFKIEAACFEHSHHLQARGRFPVKGDAVLAHHLPQQAA